MSISIQVKALEQLKKANPDGNFWIKLDGTDIKVKLSLLFYADAEYQFQKLLGFQMFIDGQKIINLVFELICLFTQSYC